MENKLKESETDQPRTTWRTVLSWEKEKSWISSRLMGGKKGSNTILVLKPLKSSYFLKKDIDSSVSHSLRLWSLAQCSTVCSYDF